MEYLHLPIPDFSIPSLEQAEKFVEFVDEVSEGTTVLAKYYIPFF